MSQKVGKLKTMHPGDIREDRIYLTEKGKPIQVARIKDNRVHYWEVGFSGLSMKDAPIGNFADMVVSGATCQGCSSHAQEAVIKKPNILLLCREHAHQMFVSMQKGIKK